MLFTTITLATVVKKWIQTQYKSITTQVKSMDTKPPRESSESDEESTTGPPGLEPCDSSSSLEELISRPGLIIDAPFRYWGDNVDYHSDYNYSDDDNNNDNNDEYDFYQDLWDNYDSDSDYNSDIDFEHSPNYQNLWQELLDSYRRMNRAANQDSSDSDEDLIYGIIQ